MATGRISKRTLDAFQSSGMTGFLWDEDLMGFGVSVAASGAASYVVQFRMGGRESPTRRQPSSLIPNSCIIGTPLFRPECAKNPARCHWPRAWTRGVETLFATYQLTKNSIPTHICTADERSLSGNRLCLTQYRRSYLPDRQPFCGGRLQSRLHGCRRHSRQMLFRHDAKSSNRRQRNPM